MEKPKPYTYRLQFLKDCHGAVKKCHGCAGKFRKDKADPEPPADLIVVSQMIRTFRKEGLEQNGKVSPVYFHPNNKCIEKMDSEFSPDTIVIDNELKAKLNVEHKKFLKQLTGKKFDAFIGTLEGKNIIRYFYIPFFYI